MKLILLDGGRAALDNNRLLTVFDFILAACDGHAKCVEHESFGIKEKITPERLERIRVAAQEAASAYAALAMQCADIQENN